jgi:hypothetical protein
LTKSLAELALQEKIRRQRLSSLIVDDSFPEQASFIKDPSQFLNATCTRRAGKSTGFSFKFYNASRKYSNVMLPYISLTRDSAKNIMWPIFQEVAYKQKIEAEFVESKLEIRTGRNSTIKLFGADMPNFINRLRGIKTPFAGVDEGQSFRAHLQELVDDILTPAISDFPDGQLGLTGTPGPVPKGYYYEVSKGMHGFKSHFWTVYKNPYFPRAQDFAESLLKKKGWTRDNPTFRREWLGEWVADSEALVYRFTDAQNLADELPLAQDELLYVLGVDLGYYPDPSAFVLCCYSPFDRYLYVIDTHIEHKMDVSAVAERIQYYLKLFPFCKVVADLGAQGKMIGAEITRRFNIPVMAADKHGKSGFIEIMNSDMRAGLIKVLRSCAPPLVDEWMNLIWDSESDRREEDSRYPNHLSDAALYAWRFCYNYAHQHRPQAIKKGSEADVDQFWEKESQELENKKQNERDLYGG